MSTEETYMRFTFPVADKLLATMSEKTVRAEFGSFSMNHIQLAILLIFEKSIALGGEDMRQYLVEYLEEVLAKVKTGKGKSALLLFKEMKDA
jgi:hypothetical protein